MNRSTFCTQTWYGCCIVVNPSVERQGLEGGGGCNCHGQGHNEGSYNQNKTVSVILCSFPTKFNLMVQRHESCEYKSPRKIRQFGHLVKCCCLILSARGRCSCFLLSARGRCCCFLLSARGRCCSFFLSARGRCCCFLLSARGRCFLLSARGLVSSWTTQAASPSARGRTVWSPAVMLMQPGCLVLESCWMTHAALHRPLSVRSLSFCKYGPPTIALC